MKIFAAIGQSIVKKPFFSRSYRGNITKISFLHRSTRLHSKAFSSPRSGDVVHTAMKASIPLIGRLLKLRYLLFGGALGGGYAAKNKYQDFKDSMPDFSWLNDVLPKEFTESISESFRKVSSSLSSPDMTWFHDSVSNIRESGAKIFQRHRLSLGYHNEANAEETGKERRSRLFSVLDDIGLTKEHELTAEKAKTKRLQDEILEIQMKYQKELEKLEKHNKELKKEILLLAGKNSKKSNIIQKSLIDMYSEVLDELSEYDSAYKVQDQLPRVVVIGDQSSGKTSVLEMIVQARIFPRGGGEMMTRSPVQVTLSEGPYHVAQFKDSSREFDLTKENDLLSLQKEIELRMKSALKEGETISKEVISLNVKGPGLQRMVLVDLPGIISTETQGMAADTKNAIMRLASDYMLNPNAIILCIQDGSVDAERSNVTDLVNRIDPIGRRTIFVLTKVDLAETTLYNPNRIKKILEGNLFPMKALGYFAVVTGTGNADDSIKDINDYEEKFFRNSRLFREGALKPSQMTAKNMSLAVSECFWRMVKESIEQQADAYKAVRYNLEAEWRNSFPKAREQDRNELFEKARNEILDEIVNLSQITPKEWQEILYENIWKSMSNFVFEEIFLPASQFSNLGSFNTKVDVILSQSVENFFPRNAVEIARNSLLDVLKKLVEQKKAVKSHDVIICPVEDAIIKEIYERFEWDTKAIDSLKVIQSSSIEDKIVPDKQNWENAVKFMEKAVKSQSAELEKRLNTVTGPSLWHQWAHWTKLTDDQKTKRVILHELQKLTQNKHQSQKSELDFDDVTAVKSNLMNNYGIQASIETIKEVWNYVYRRSFLQNSLATCSDCTKFFFYYQKGFSDQGLDCREIELFWRINKLIEVTSHALRLQIFSIEARRLERVIKDTLDELSQNNEFKNKFITGRRVDLAEKLRKVRSIQEKLEEFVRALSKE